MSLKFLLLLAAIAAVHGVPNAKKNVIVIGSGMSGLSASVKLLNAGYNVTILEARNRIGGRIKTRPLDPKAPNSPTFDFGASFIHGLEGGNPLEPLAEAAKSDKYVPELGQVFLPAYNKSPATLLDLENSMGMAGLGEMAMGQLGEFVAANFDKIPQRESLKAKAIEFTTAAIQEAAAKAPGITELVDPAATAELPANINGATLADYSLKHFFVEKTFSGPEPILRDGYLKLLKSMAAPVLDRVILKQVVTKVRANKNGVQIVTANSASYNADAVVVTVPLGVLKANTIAFEPALPADKADAIRQQGMGLLNKVLIKFSDLKWFPEIDFLSLPPQLHPPAAPGLDTKSTFVNVWNLNTSYKMPYLCFFTYGPFAEQIEKLNDNQAAKLVMDILRSRVKEAPTKFSVEHVTRWRKSPYAGGSYSYFALASRGAETLKALAKPSADNRVFWAGEHTTEYLASVHGAYMSGQRAADDVIANLK